MKSSLAVRKANRERSSPETLRFHARKGSRPWVEIDYLIDVGPTLLPGVLAVMDRRDYYTVQRCDAAAAAPKSSSLLTSGFVRLAWVSSKAFSRESSSKLSSKRKEKFVRARVAQ